MRWKKAAETWGVYGLALLCAAVILFSAWWTRGQDAAERQALSDGSQRLQDVTASPAPLRLVRPCAGELVRGFDAAPVFFAQSGLWQIHPRLDFAAPAGTPVRAMLPGTAMPLDDGVRVEHADGSESVYRGVTGLRVEAGASVRAGDVLGVAAGAVPGEGKGCVCVALYRGGVPVDYAALLVDKNEK